MRADLGKLRESARKTIETPDGEFVVRRLRAGDWLEVLDALPVVPDAEDKGTTRESAAVRKALDVADKLLIAGVVEPALDADSVRVIPQETARILADAIAEFSEFRPFGRPAEREGPRDGATC